MLLLVLGLTWCTGVVHGFIPPYNVCYQHKDISNACTYGNLTVALIGKTLKPRDCNSHINIKELESAPFLYINSTNTTERFTVLMVDLGPTGRGPDYLQWMVTNVSINSLPNYNTIPINNVLAAYTPPLLMQGQGSQSTLVQILVFRHYNVLRVPFGELWVTKRRNFELSQLYSNTSPILRLCGPVAGAQYWVHEASWVPQALPPVQPGYVPPGSAPGYVPAGYVPGYVPPPSQPGYAPLPPQPGNQPAGQPSYVPPGAQPGFAPVQPGYNPGYQQPPPKKASGTVSKPIALLFVPAAVFTLICAKYNH